MVLNGCVLTNVMFLAKPRALVGEQGDGKVVRFEFLHNDEESVFRVDCSKVSVGNVRLVSAPVGQVRHRRRCPPEVFLVYWGSNDYSRFELVPCELTVV